jgi:polyhydroxyalkanoate synthesis regulator phasin
LKSRTRSLFLILVSAALSHGGTAVAATSAEEQSLTELRNTVVNLLQGLVERGVLTREQAEKMVHDAQTKAEAETAAKAAANKAQEEAEKGAVRVPYVPQIVKDEIRKEVVAELGPSVKKEVVAEVSSTGSLRSALPDWVQRMRWTGDVRVREEGDLFARDNALNAYPDFNVINAKGGFEKAGITGLLNTTEDRNRLRLRLRFGFDTDLGAGFIAGMRLATGSGEVYPTTNQTLGTYGGRYQITVDQGFIRWNGQTSTARQLFSFTGGRFANPWLSTDLIWYNDLTFEGLAGNYRFNLGSDASHRHDLFATIGAFPLQDVVPSSKDKWLAAAQIGADITTQNESRFRIGAAYYDYLRIVGQLNAPDSTLLNYTAPPLVQKGNSMFDIANSTDFNTSLWALAANYRIVDLTAVADWHVFSRYSISVTGEALRNIGYNTAEVSARIGSHTDPRTHGYRADVGFGTVAPGPWGGWRAAFGYRYIERDAVLDAFNDQDFHLGGTDAKGYTITLDYSFNPRVGMRLKYLSANAIDGPPLGIDVWQLDLSTQF